MKSSRAVDAQIATRALARLAWGLWSIPGFIAASAHPEGISLTVPSEAAAEQVIAVIMAEYGAARMGGRWTPKPFRVAERDPTRGFYRQGFIHAPRWTIPVTVNSIWKEEA